MVIRTDTNHSHTTGKNFAINTLLSRKLERQLHKQLLDKVLTKQSWMRNSKLCNKKSWTTKCWRLAMFLWETRSALCLLHHKEVSLDFSLQDYKPTNIL